MALFKKWIDKLEKKILYVSNQDVRPDFLSWAWFLFCISFIYGFCIRIRSILYDIRILSRKTLPCFVISIGNIAVGGTGKTPMTVYISKLIKKMGKRVVVVSRGYKGRYSGDSLVVSDGETIFCRVEDCGDEPYMMAEKRIFPVVVGKNRFKAGREAIDMFKPDVIVLDDGFQHLKLERDLDLLLFDYMNPLGNNMLLPAGRLRETCQMSKQRVNALIFTRSPDSGEKSGKSRELTEQYPGTPWFRTFHRPYIASRQINRERSKESTTELPGLKGKRAVAFSGIAKNAFFYLTLKNLGINVLEHIEFQDHYRYKNEDIIQINRKAEKKNAEIILTTEKDWIKFDYGVDLHEEWVKDLIVIGVEIEFEDMKRFKIFLESELEKYE